MPEAAIQQALSGKLIALAISAIIFILGVLGTALAAAYKWVFKREIERLDEVVEFAEDLDKTQGILAMQIAVVQTNADDQKILHKESIEAVDKKIEASDRRHEKQMDRFEDYFKQFLELSSRRRKDD